MKYLFIILFTLLISQNCCAQNLKTKKKITQRFIEVYQVDKKSKIKNGFYYKLSTSTNDTLVTGQYLNDEKSGLWMYKAMFGGKYFDFDYDKKSLVSIHDDKLKSDSAYILKGDKFELDIVDHSQIYIGHKDEAQSYLASKIRLPIEIVKNGIVGRTAASFVINSEGELINPKMEFSLHKEFDKSIIDELTNIKGKWIPASKNGENVASKIILVIDVGENEMGEVKLVSYIWQLRLMYTSTVTRRRL